MSAIEDLIGVAGDEALKKYPARERVAERELIETGGNLSLSPTGKEIRSAISEGRGLGKIHLRPPFDETSDLVESEISIEQKAIDLLECTQPL